MAKRPNLGQISSPVFTVSQLNEAYAKIDNAFDNTLSRDGSTPNTMQADLDMNSNDILNAGVLYGTTVNVDEAYIGGKLFTGTLTWRSDWLTSTSYQENDLVKINGNVYVCLDEHTSGVFASDLSALRWELFVENTEGPEGPPGPDGPAGQGVPVGGTTGQVLAKIDGTNYNTEWVDQSGGAGVTDGDKGDITVSASGSTWTIDNNAVTLAKMADFSTDVLLGRDTAGSGDPELIGVGGGVEFNGAGSIRTSAFTGDVTKTAGATSLTIANDVVSNAKLANVATSTIKGRVTAGTGDPEDLTGTQATTLLDVFTTSLKGLAPASGGGTTNFLRADGTWAAPGGGGGGSGDVVGPASATDNAIARFDTTTGKLIQNSGATIDDNGVLNLPVASVPSAPAVSTLSMFARSLGGRVMPAFIGPSGLGSFVQPHLGGNRVLFVSPTSGTTAPSAWGGSIGVAGTASFQQSFASTNRWLSTARKRYQSTTTAGNAVSTRQAYTNWMRGSAAGFGGFFFRVQFGNSINLNGSQCFVGLCPATGALGGDPSTDFPLNMCGMGFDSGDASTGNWQFFRNDGAGGVVKVDLGATNAARAADVGYELVMFIAPGGSELFVQITNLNTGADVLTTSYTTDIPSANTGLCLKCDARNGAVAAACNLEWAKIYIESDY